MAGTYNCPLTLTEKKNIDTIKENVGEQFDEFISHNILYRMLHVKSFRKAVSQTITEGLEPFLKDPEAALTDVPKSDYDTLWEIARYEISSLRASVPTICENDQKLRKRLVTVCKAYDVNWKRMTVNRLEEVEKAIYNQLDDFVKDYTQPPYARRG